MTDAFHNKKALWLAIIALNIVGVVFLTTSVSMKAFPRLFSQAQEPNIFRANAPSKTVHAAEIPFNDFVTEENVQANARYAPRQIIIKLKGHARTQINKKLGIQAKRLSTTGIKSFDALNRKFKAKHVEPLVPALKTLQLKTNKNDTQLFEQVKNKYPARTKRIPESKGAPALTDYYVVSFEKTSTPIEQMVKAYAKDTNIELAEPDYVYRTFALPNDTYVDPDGDGMWKTGSVSADYEDMWGLTKIGYETAWNQGVIVQGNSVTVAVIDTGVDRAHADLANSVWKNTNEIEGNTIDDDNNGYVDDVWGWNFVSNSNNPLDDVGHGTHVAGIIAATTNNARGIASIAPKTQIMNLKGLGPNGGYTSDLVEALYYAVNNGADVLNNSWGGKGVSSALGDAVVYAQNAGVSVVAAAGNSNEDASQFYPAGIDGVFTVASSGPNDFKSTFSNWGDTVEVSAPGESILSLRANGTTLGRVVDEEYLVASGTSMSSPFTAGVVALMVGYLRDYNLPWTINEIYHRIMKGSDNINSNNYDYAGRIGAGRIHIMGALSASPSADVRYHATTIQSGGDQYLDSGEEARLTVSLKNYWQDADGVTATLTSETQGVDVVHGTAQYGRVLENAIVSNAESPFVIRIGSGFSAMSSITFTLAIHGSNGYSKNELLRFPIGKPAKLITALADEDSTGESSGDGDGILEANEKAEIRVELHNPSATTARNITLKLSTTQNTSIVRSESSIDTIDAKTNKRNDAHPFIIQTPGDFPIGKTLFFTLTVLVDNEKVFTAPVVLKSDTNFNYYSLGDSWYSDDHQIEPAFAGDGIQTKYAVWRDSRYHPSDGDILFAKSSDNGQSFSNPVVVNTINGYMNTMPKIALGSDGTIYIAWIYIPESNIYSFDVYVSKSSDGGNTFSQPKSITGPHVALYDRYKPAVKLAIYGDNVYLAWADEREGSNKSKIYFARSGDKGDSFQLTTPTNQLYQGMPDIAVNSSGRIVLVYEHNRRLYIITSDNGGATFSQGTTVSAPTSGFQYWSQVKTIGQNTVFGIWAEQVGPGLNYVYVVKSTDGGVTFTAPVRVDSVLHGWSQDRPSISVSSENDVAVVYSEMTSDGLSFYQSKNSGSTFSPREALILSNIKDLTNWTNYVTVDGDAAHVYWDEYVRDKGKMKVSMATRVAKDQSIKLQEGWNYIGLAVNPNIPITASSLLSQAQTSGVICKSVARYAGGQWAYYPSISSDYTLELYKGYFMQCLNAGEFNITGRMPVYDFSKTALSSTGWHSVTLPIRTAMTAKGFCDESKATFSGTTIEIDRWINGGWDGHVCGLPFNDFPIEAGKGYLVKHELAGQTAPALNAPQ